MTFPSFVKIVEVGPRDGLQHEAVDVATETKIEFINQLSDSGLSVIETTSFVSSKWIPQLADGEEVFARINKKRGVHYPVLIPNEKGLQRALTVDVKDIAVFTTPSELFSQKNTNCSVAESVARIAALMPIAKKHGLRVRGYLSCVLGCPYEGEMDPNKVAVLAAQLIELGCDEISLGDTIGVGTPLKTQILLDTVAKKVSMQKLAVHFHDTYGEALANICAALERGCAIVDSSVAGIGGCPYAVGASGNVATEDVLYLLQGMNIKTDVNLEKIIAAGRFITKALYRTPQSKVSIAFNNRSV